MTVPEALHLVEGQEVVQGSGGKDAALLQEQNPVGAAEGRTAVGDDEAGGAALPEMIDPLPEHTAPASGS